MKRSFFQYVSLNVLGALGLSGYILADTLFVAHRLGTDGLAALNLAISVFGLINGLGLMLGIGGATRYAICRTQGDGVRADRAFSRALACGGALGGLLALAGLLWAVPLARLLGAEGAILPMCSVYLRTVLLFAPCFLLNHILTAFVRNDGNPKLAMAAMLLGSLSNIVLDYVFLYPMDMGIFGAALATGIAPVVGLCVSSLHILTRRSRFRLRPFRPALRPLADLAGLGSAAFLNECSSGLVLVVFNLLTLRLAGTLGVAAYGIVANLALVVIAVFTGVAQGAQPLISRSHGQGRPDLARRVLGYGLTVCLAMAGVLYILLALFAPEVAALFNSEGDPVLAATAVEGLRLYFLSAPLAGVNIMAATYFAATQQALPAQLLSLLRGLFLVVPAALLLSALWGVWGLWLALPAAELAAALVCAVLFLRLKKS